MPKINCRHCSWWLAAIGVLIAVVATAHDKPARAARTSVVATGLNNPRGLTFGPRGFLYVAEGGVGGSHSTVGECEQVIAPTGPYTGGDTGSRISRISPRGERTTVVDNLPSSQTSPALGGLVSGVADIAFVGHTLTRKRRNDEALVAEVTEEE